MLDMGRPKTTLLEKTMKRRGFKLVEIDGESYWSNGHVTLWAEQVERVQCVFVGSGDGCYARQVPSDVLAALSAELGATP